MRPILGRYRIHALSIDTGPYSLEIMAIRGDCTRESTLRKGNTRKGKVDAYSLEYRDGYFCPNTTGFFRHHGNRQVSPPDR